MDYEFESIIPWNGEHDTGRDARQKLDRNFAKIKSNFEELAGARFVTADFFARLFGIEGEDGEAVTVNDLEAGITAIQSKFGFYSNSYLSALGRNPDSGGSVAGATELAGLTDVALTNPANGQALVYQNGKWVNQTVEAGAGLDEAALAQYLSVHKYATQDWVLQQLQDNPQTGYVTTAFFARLFGIEGEDGAAVDVNDLEAAITAIQAKFGFYSGQWISAKGKNPSSGGTSAGIDEEQLADYLTQNGYATQQWVQSQGYATLDDIPEVDLTDYATKTWASGQFALKTTQIIAGTGLTGGGSLSANRTLSLAAVGTAGTYTKVTVDAYGRVTGHSSLTESDIPTLSISKISGLRDELDSKLDADVFEELFEKVYVSGYGYAIRAKLALYSNDWISALGQNSSSGGATAGLDEEQLAEYLTDHGYATQTWVRNQSYLDASALDGYATQTWVNQQGFAKDVKWSNLAGRPAPLVNGTYFYDRQENVESNWNNYDANGAYAAYVEAGSFSQSNAPTGTYNYGLLAVFNQGVNVAAQMYMPHNGVAPKFRVRFDGAWSGWATLALTSSKVSDASHADSADTATVATRLQTARTLWGQTFNGTQNVSGSLTNTGSVTPSANNAYALGSSSLRYSGVYANNGYFANVMEAYEYVANNANMLKYGAFTYKNVISYGWDSTLADYITINIPGSSNHSQKLELMAGGIGGLRVTGNLVATGYINAGSYLQVGGARLYYDSSTNALYVQKSDGSTCGFYATGFLSAKGKNSSSGGAVAGAEELNDLDDVLISSPSSGQVLTYYNGYWRNRDAPSGGGGSASVAWSDITGKPSWIGSSKPSYAWSEITGKPSWIGSSKPSYSFGEITGTPTIAASSSNATNLSINVEGAVKSISSLYADYLGGTSKANLFSSMSYSSNKLSITIGGTTKSVTIQAGSSGGFQPGGSAVTGNWNNYTSSGCWSVYPEAGSFSGSNAPSQSYGSYGILLVFNTNAESVVQMFIPQYGENRIQIRLAWNYGSSWSGWKVTD